MFPTIRIKRCLLLRVSARLSNAGRARRRGQVSTRKNSRQAVGR